MATTVSSPARTWVSQGVTLPCATCVCIVGGGNIATAAAAWLSRSDKNIRVHVLTRQPEKWTKKVRVGVNPQCHWASLKSFEADISLITSDPKEAVTGANVVMIAAPAQAHLELLQKVKPYVKDGAVLGTLFGQGGFDWAVSCAFGDDIKRIGAVFGLQHVPWLAYAKKYGHEVDIVGPKDFLCVAVTPKSARVMVESLLQMCFDQPCKSIPNFMCLTLTPSNQIIHPARYYAMFKDWDGVRVYKENEVSWGLYSEFDQDAADYLGKLDAELQAVKNALAKKFPDLDLSTVLPLKERIIQQYGDDVKDRTDLLSVMRTNMGYSATRTPMAAVEGGFQPKVQSRLFYEDIPSGLCVLRNMAEMLNLQTPTIDLMIQWHQKFMNIEYLKDGKLNPETINLTTTPARYGITTLEQLVAASRHGF